jgi:hypothetical protein
VPAYDNTHFLYTPAVKLICPLLNMPVVEASAVGTFGSLCSEINDYVAVGRGGDTRLG